VSVLLAIAILVVVTGGAVAAMLLVRRTAPDGGYFADGDRAAGVFGVLATGFAVLLGFVVFLAFTSYDTARSGAETEAAVVLQQVETAQLMPDEVQEELLGGLLCYSRSVAGVQWDRMQEGTLEDDELNIWSVALFDSIKDVEPGSASEEAAYERWLDQRAEREEARGERLHGAVGVIPTPLWLVLFFSASVIFVYMLFFADSGERALVQAMLMGSVVAVLVSMLLLLQFLDNPFHDGVGGLRPVAMERALETFEREIVIEDLTVDPACTEDGRPL
jgi:hypothetical protein